MPWVRTGECEPERCKGRCCEHVGIWLTPDRAFVTFLRTRGLPVGQKRGMALLDIPQRCQWLSEQGLCRLHPDMDPPSHYPARPQLCRDWPTDPSQLMADRGCGYTFEWVEEVPEGAKG